LGAGNAGKGRPCPEADVANVSVGWLAVPSAAAEECLLRVQVPDIAASGNGLPVQVWLSAVPRNGSFTGFPRYSLTVNCCVARTTTMWYGGGIVGLILVVLVVLFIVGRL